MWASSCASRVPTSRHWLRSRSAAPGTSFTAKSLTSASPPATSIGMMFAADVVLGVLVRRVGGDRLASARRGVGDEVLLRIRPVARRSQDDWRICGAT